jgi:putative ABC transport system substrate-binding protein
MFYANRVRITSLATRSQVPTMFAGSDYVAAGGLMSYQASNDWHWRTAADFVDKILKGAKPGDIPVAQPTEFTLAINLKTAKAIGVAFPPSLLLRADEKIE